MRASQRAREVRTVYIRCRHAQRAQTGRHTASVRPSAGPRAARPAFVSIVSQCLNAIERGPYRQLELCCLWRTSPSLPAAFVNHEPTRFILYHIMGCVTRWQGAHHGRPYASRRAERAQAPGGTAQEMRSGVARRVPRSKYSRHVTYRLSGPSERPAGAIGRVAEGDGVQTYGSERLYGCHVS